MLTGKIAVITGASRGIGAAIARKLADKNAYVIINYNGSRSGAQAVLDSIIDNGGAGEICQCNVSDYDACSAFIAEVVKKHGRVDILVNNAGITRDGLMMGMSEEDFDSVINTNLKGTFNCTKAVSRTMLKQRSGKVINMASIVGIRGNAGQTNYAASKAGVIGFTMSAAKELARKNINVNAVAPGFIETEMTAVLPEEVKNGAKASIPMGKFGTPEDVANAVAFLAGPDSDYITGQVISVDGGM